VPPIRVLVVDDHRVFTDALAARLEAEPGLTVVGTAGSVAAAYAAATPMRPHVVLLDMELGDGNGLTLMPRLAEHHPDIRVVVVTCNDNVRAACDSVRAGALGFVPKDASIDRLCNAIRGAMLDETWMPPRLLTGVLRKLREEGVERNRYQQRIAQLSARERDVLYCMARGLDRQAIAEELLMSVNTVRTHIQHCYEKLGVHSALEAANVAMLASRAPSASPASPTAPST
jgi:DNA-binding NarL/FixJ family response regulator